ncbi:hypothetical protein EVAR_91506_1 [Eumeta japonica]|uniref:Uncharacterized protein n=1 Tax=Eumeta variegata TaxID=151549 RepID=A0A4C1VE92_EUMVA|nr:hypothetical protein EVAR_91506_1 [Eumeta japonica]
MKNFVLSELCRVIRLCRKNLYLTRSLAADGICRVNLFSRANSARASGARRRAVCAPFPERFRPRRDRASLAQIIQSAADFKVLRLFFNFDHLSLNGALYCGNFGATQRTLGGKATAGRVIEALFAHSAGDESRRPTCDSRCNSVIEFWNRAARPAVAAWINYCDIANDINKVSVIAQSGDTWRGEGPLAPRQIFDLLYFPAAPRSMSRRRARARRRRSPLAHFFPCTSEAIIPSYAGVSERRALNGRHSAFLVRAIRGALMRPTSDVAGAAPQRSANTGGVLGYTRKTTVTCVPYDMCSDRSSAAPPPPPPELFSETGAYRSLVTVLLFTPNRGPRPAASGRSGDRGDLQARGPLSASVPGKANDTGSKLNRERIGTRPAADARSDFSLGH